MIVSLFFFVCIFIHLSKAANPGLPARRNELRSHSTNVEKDLEELQTKTVVALPSPDIRKQCESGLTVRVLGPPGPPGPAESSWGFPEERNVGDDAYQLYVRGPRLGIFKFLGPEKIIGGDPFVRTVRGSELNMRSGGSSMRELGKHAGERHLNEGITGPRGDIKVKLLSKDPEQLGQILSRIPDQLRS